ncbi:MAG TPA: hypothetical protein VIO58_14450 [Candidatus Methanoperedens sp.]
MEKRRIIQITVAVLVILTMLIFVASVVSIGNATVDKTGVFEKKINEKSPGKIQVRPTTLTYPLYRARAVWDGRYIYILGGTGTHPIIHNYKPLTLIYENRGGVG